MRKNYVKNIIVGQLSINSIRNKFLPVKELLSQNLDLLIINEMKLYDSFPNAQYQLMLETSLAEHLWWRVLFLL